ncbi:MAG: DUF4105 domain-containing protein [Bdellovibrionales bacterium]|nr:DUF4105 domain-containing protein [Bdellovibrionales bacterium]
MKRKLQTALLFFLSLSVFFQSFEEALATTSSPVEQAIRAGAAHDTQWLKLGFWRERGLLGRTLRSRYLSEADDARFFISPDGAKDPEAELRATLQAFLQPLNEEKNESLHAQCLYPARRTWALRKLGWEKVLNESGIGILPCAERAKWKQELDAEGVSLVFASAYLNNAASMFGHTFLKFHSRRNRDGRDLLDYGVNFAAETGSDGGVPFAFYGLTGFYPGRFSLQPFHETLRTYSNLEGRDLIEYRLNLSQEEIDFFIDHLLELERTYFDYYFLSENCSYFLLAALEAAKPSVDLTSQFWYQVIPADSIRVVTRTPDLVLSTLYRPSLMATFRNQAANATRAELDFAKNVVDGQSGIDQPPRESWNQTSLKALDLALDYGAIRANSDTKKFEAINHQLRVARAQRGGTSTAETFETPKRPEEGHDPGKLGLIYELPSERTSKQEGRFGLQFRFAYHERLSNDDGYLKGTTLEVLRTSIFSDHEDPSRILMREITVFDVFSSQPRDRFAQPTSWRAAFGFRTPQFHEAHEVKSTGPYVNGGIGSTLAFSLFGAPIWFTGLISGEVLSNPDLERGIPFHLGPKIVGTAFLHRTLKLGFDASLMRAISNGRNYDLYSTQLVWSPTQHFEFRTEFTSANIEATRRTQWSFQIHRHILF